jgi:hypothetical protein
VYTYRAGTVWRALAVDGDEDLRFITQCNDKKGWKCIFVLVVGFLVGSLSCSRNVLMWPSSWVSVSAMLWDRPYNHYGRDMHLHYVASNGEVSQRICIFGTSHFTTLQAYICCVSEHAEVWRTTSECPGEPFLNWLTSVSVGLEVSKIWTYVNGQYHPKINIIVIKHCNWGERKFLILAL